MLFRSIAHSIPSRSTSTAKRFGTVWNYVGTILVPFLYLQAGIAHSIPSHSASTANSFGTVWSYVGTVLVPFLYLQAGIAYSILSRSSNTAIDVDRHHFWLFCRLRAAEYTPCTHRTYHKHTLCIYQCFFSSRNTA